MLVASIAAKIGFFPVTEGFQWLAGWPAIICFGTVTVAEILAYYIPFIDNLLDGITTPLAIGAGTVLFISVLPVDSDMLKWTLGFVIGGGAAAPIQTGSVFTRLASSKFTAGTGNAFVATGEHAVAFGFSVLSFLIPLFIAFILLVLISVIILKSGKKSSDLIAGYE